MPLDILALLPCRLLRLLSAEGPGSCARVPGYLRTLSAEAAPAAAAAAAAAAPAAALPEQQQAAEEAAAAQAAADLAYSGFSTPTDAMANFLLTLSQV